MHIIYIHQYFRTPSEPGGTRSYWISRELIKAGHRVTMIGSGKPDQPELLMRKNVDGIEVIYVRNEYTQKFGILQRLKSFTGFMWKATRALWKEKKPDLVIATSTPLTVGVPALLYKKLKGVPYLFEVRDLWPEVPVQMGALKNGFVRRLALALEKSIYKNARHIVALSPGMQEGVTKVVRKKEKVSMIPNMAKVDKFWKREKNKELEKELNLKPGSFKLIHFGAMGLANGLDYILDAATILKEKNTKEVEFIFLGDGSVADDLKNTANKRKLENVHFLGKKPMDQTSEIVNLCDASIVPFLNLPILYTNSPNKLFDSLSAGLPIIVNSNGWTREMVETHHCGAWVDPENPVELADLILKWKEDPEALDKMGQNARRLAETKYDKAILCQEFVKVVHSLDI